MLVLVRDYGHDGLQVCAVTDSAYGAMVWENADHQCRVIECELNCAPDTFRVMRDRVRSHSNP